MMRMPHSSSASGILGVSTVAKGNRRVRNASSASSSSSLAPEVATMTGSTTSCAGRCVSIASATAWMTFAFASIPSLTAPMRKSSKQASICARRKPISGTWTAVTPRVFCAVSAAIAERPCTPCAAKVFRSAWIPAPPPESEPAMVSAQTGRAGPPWSDMRAFCPKLASARCRLMDDRLGQPQRAFEIRGEVQFGRLFLEPHPGDDPVGLFLQSGNDQHDALAMAAMGELLQRVHAAGIDHRHQPHAQDEYLRWLQELVQQVVQAVRGAEEQRAADLVHLDALRQHRALIEVSAARVVVVADLVV